MRGIAGYASKQSHCDTNRKMDCNDLMMLTSLIALPFQLGSKKTKTARKPLAYARNEQ
jgi:hypothetical protein